MIHNKQITHVCLKKVRRSKKKKDRANVRKNVWKIRNGTKRRKIREGKCTAGVPVGRAVERKEEKEQL